MGVNKIVLFVPVPLDFVEAEMIAFCSLLSVFTTLLDSNNPLVVNSLAERKDSNIDSSGVSDLLLVLLTEGGNFCFR